MVSFTGADDLAGAQFVGTDLRGAWFRESDLRGVRARGADLRDFLGTLTDEQLGEKRGSPVFARIPQVPLGQCLWIIMNEEWHHHRYAVRDLQAIEAGRS